MSIYSKSLNTHNYEGSIHVSDLLYLYEKIHTIAFHRFPDFKKIEPSFNIRSEQGDSTDLTVQKLENSFSPDEPLSSCSFILQLPPSVNLQPSDNHHLSGNDQQDVSSISFASTSRHSIHITAEGTNQQQVDALVNTIIYSINPYISDMNIGRLPPVKHEERTFTIKTEPAKHDKPDISKNILEAQPIKSNLSEQNSELPGQDSLKDSPGNSRKNSKYIIAGIIVIVLVIAIVIIIASLK